MAPPLARRLVYSIDSAAIGLFMSLSHDTMNDESPFNRHCCDIGCLLIKFIKRA